MALFIMYEPRYLQQLGESSPRAVGARWDRPAVVDLDPATPDNATLKKWGGTAAQVPSGYYDATPGRLLNRNSSNDAAQDHSYNGFNR